MYLTKIKQGDDIYVTFKCVMGDIGAKLSEGIASILSSGDRAAGPKIICGICVERPTFVGTVFNFELRATFS